MAVSVGATDLSSWTASRILVRLTIVILVGLAPLFARCLTADDSEHAKRRWSWRAKRTHNQATEQIKINWIA
jgi:hypothetical protein